MRKFMEVTKDNINNILISKEFNDIFRNPNDRYKYITLYFPKKVHDPYIACGLSADYLQNNYTNFICVFERQLDLDHLELTESSSMQFNKLLATDFKFDKDLFGNLPTLMHKQKFNYTVKIILKCKGQEVFLGQVWRELLGYKGRVKK